MIDFMKGFPMLIKEQNPHNIQTHCFLKEEVFAWKPSSIGLKVSFHVTVDMANYIKSRLLKSHLSH